MWKVDKKAMIRKQYKRIPHPALNTKRERDTYNYDGTKIKTAHGQNPRADGHKAILNKLNSKSKTNRKRTIRINHNRSIALERSVINSWKRGGAAGAGLKAVLRCNNLALGGSRLYRFLIVAFSSTLESANVVGESATCSPIQNCRQ